MLRVLDTGEFEPIGSNHTQVCRARVIAASNWDLEAAVEDGRFRRDLYYRLSVMPIHLPPLRQRVQDIAPLAQMMLARFSQRLGKDLRGINAKALAALEAPGAGGAASASGAGNRSRLSDERDHAACRRPPSAGG